MTSTFTANKVYQLQGTGDNPNTWGSVLNTNVFSIIDSNLGATLSISVAGSSNVNITQAQAANLKHTLTGLLTGNIAYNFPASQGGFFIIDNTTTGAFTVTVKPTGGTGIVVPQNKKMLVFINGTTNALTALSDVPSTGPESTLASASTTDLGTAPTNFVNITGTTTITAFGSTAIVGNPLYWVRFASALTLTYNATSMILPTSASISAAAGDTALMEYLGSGNWRCISYQRFTGASLLSTVAEATIASATTTDLGSTGSNIVSITGTTTITGLGSTAVTTNPIYNIRFTGALTFTHNATSLIIPGAQNITTVAGDTAVAKYEGSGNWRIVSYQRASGQAISITGTEATLASATTTDLGSTGVNAVSVTGTTTITGLGSSAFISNPYYFIRFTGALTFTHNATSLILPGAANITTAAGDTAVMKYEGSGNWRCMSYQKASGKSISGSVVIATSSYVTNTTFSTAIPADDTIPQIGEGTQMFSMSYTPLNASSKIVIFWDIYGGFSGGAAQYLAAPLFKDGAANALKTPVAFGTGGAGVTSLHGQYTETAGSLSARTYAIRVGLNTGDFYPNGTAGATRLYGGTSECLMTILEILP